MPNIDNNVYNFALFLVDGLRHSSPIKTGAMRASITLKNITGYSINIVIGVDYASYVNEQKKHMHWIQKTIDRYSRAYAQNNVSEDNFFSVNAILTYGNGGK